MPTPSTASSRAVGFGSWRFGFPRTPGGWGTPHRCVHTPRSGEGGSAPFGGATGGPDPIGWGHSEHIPNAVGSSGVRSPRGGFSGGEAGGIGRVGGSEGHRGGAGGGQPGPTRQSCWVTVALPCRKEPGVRPRVPTWGWQRVGVHVGFGVGAHGHGVGLYGVRCQPHRLFFQGPECCELSAVAEARRFLSRCARRLLGEGLRGLYYYLLSLRGGEKGGEKKKKKPPLLGTVPNRSTD